jgi:hypothetical protein
MTEYVDNRMVKMWSKWIDGRMEVRLVFLGQMYEGLSHLGIAGNETVTVPSVFPCWVRRASPTTNHIV